MANRPPSFLPVQSFANKAAGLRYGLDARFYIGQHYLGSKNGHLTGNEGINGPYALTNIIDLCYIWV